MQDTITSDSSVLSYTEDNIHPIVTEKKKVFNILKHTVPTLQSYNEPVNDNGHPLVDESRGITNLYEGGTSGAIILKNRVSGSSASSRSSSSKSDNPSDDAFPVYSNEIKLQTSDKDIGSSPVNDHPSIFINEWGEQTDIENLRSSEHLEQGKKASFNPEEEFQRILARFPNIKSKSRLPNEIGSRVANEINVTTLPGFKLNRKSLNRQSILHKFATESDLSIEHEQDDSNDEYDPKSEASSSLDHAPPAALKSTLRIRVAPKSSLKHDKPRFVMEIEEPSTSKPQERFSRFVTSSVRATIPQDDTTDPRKRRKREYESPIDDHVSIISIEDNNVFIDPTSTRISVLSNFSLKRKTVLSSLLPSARKTKIVPKETDEILKQDLTEKKGDVTSESNGNLEQLEENELLNGVTTTALTKDGYDENRDEPVIEIVGSTDLEQTQPDTYQDLVDLPHSINYQDVKTSTSDNVEESEVTLPSSYNEKEEAEDLPSLLDTKEDEVNLHLPEDKRKAEIILTSSYEEKEDEYDLHSLKGKKEDECELHSLHDEKDDECDLHSFQDEEEDECDLDSSQHERDECELYSLHDEKEDECELHSLHDEKEDECELHSLHDEKEDECDLHSFHDEKKENETLFPSYHSIKEDEVSLLLTDAEKEEYEVLPSPFDIKESGVIDPLPMGKKKVQVILPPSYVEIEDEGNLPSSYNITKDEVNVPLPPDKKEANKKEKNNENLPSYLSKKEGKVTVSVTRDEGEEKKSKDKHLQSSCNTKNKKTKSIVNIIVRNIKDFADLLVRMDRQNDSQDSSWSSDSEFSDDENDYAICGCNCTADSMSTDGSSSSSSTTSNNGIDNMDIINKKNLKQSSRVFF